MLTTKEYGEHQAPSKSGRTQGGGSPARVAYASGMVDGASKVGYAMPSIVVVMHIDICEGRGVGVGWEEGEWLVVVDDW